MATPLLQFLSLTLLFTTFILFPHHTLSQDDSPSPSPLPTSSSPSPPPATADPSPSSSSPSPASVYSPPAPPPSDLAPKSTTPAPSPGEDDDEFVNDRKKSPAPAPTVSGEVNRASAGDFEANYDDSSSSDGMNGGKKAGVAIGVIAGACVIGAGVLIYKKRQQNIRRSQYGSAARRDFL